MEALQLSQVLADLSNLGAAEPDAAAAIVNANKTEPAASAPRSAPSTTPQPPATPSSSSSQTQIQTQSHQRRPSSSLQRAWSNDPAGPVDKFGRRIMVTSPSTPRSGSCTPGVGDKTDDDLERAATLMALYDIRSKLKQQDNSSLAKAREKINALAARQQAQAQAQNQVKPIRSNRYSYPKPGL